MAGELVKLKDRAAQQEKALADRKKAVLAMRRRGIGFDQIAEELGFEDRFEVIDVLNDVYKSLRPINVEEIRDTVETQIDDLITVYSESAHDGNHKSAKFILEALKLKLQLRGAIQPPQVNVQINNQKPWERVYGAVLSDPNNMENIVEGEVVDGE